MSDLMKTELWIFGREDRDKVAAILVSNGYTVSQIERPNADYPSTRKDTGLLVRMED